MNSLKLLLMVGIIGVAPSRLVVAETPQMPGRPEAIPDHSIKAIFESSNLAHTQKWNAAKSVRNISASDRVALQTLEHFK